MTPEQTIKIIKCAIGEVEWDYPIDYAEAFENAIETLKKEVPKKPIDVYMSVVTWGLCPTCKGELNKLGGRPNRMFQHDAYCSDCGQKLDWSEE